MVGGYHKMRNCIKGGQHYPVKTHLLMTAAANSSPHWYMSTTIFSQRDAYSISCSEISREPCKDKLAMLLTAGWRSPSYTSSMNHSLPILRSCFLDIFMDIHISAIAERFFFPIGAIIFFKHPIVKANLATWKVPNWLVLDCDQDWIALLVTGVSRIIYSWPVPILANKSHQEKAFFFLPCAHYILCNGYVPGIFSN